MTLALRKFKGRFANQLFEYANLRQVAKESGQEYECPPWIGQKLFGLKDKPPNRHSTLFGTDFPKHSSFYDKELFQALYTPIDEIRKQVGALPSLLKMMGHDIVAIHLRRGDYGTFRRKTARWCFVAPTQWYLDWLHDHLHDLIDPVLVIASDEPDKVVTDFRHFNVVIPTAIPEADFYADFYCLSHCDYLLTSNSTFSFAASMLASPHTQCWRPRLSKRKLIPYDPWNADVVFKDERYA